MRTVTRSQTIIRLPVELMARLKYQAKRENLSFNAFVERTLDTATAVKTPKLKELTDEDRAWAAKYKIIPTPTQEMLESDPKLSYIMNKGR